MTDLLCAPYAPALIESMRAVGYTLESAIADLIDNSISANARNISIRYSPHDEPYVAIVDDGYGMWPDVLTTAMRHGSKNPKEERSSDDLGRFGLGLKTASLSQCKKLTVVSLRDGDLSARCWDLDYIEETEDWLLKVPSKEEILKLPCIALLQEFKSGTMVLWQHLDRLTAGSNSISSTLSEKMDIARDHLSLVFHRYLSGDENLPRLLISLNNNPLIPFDPFLLWHRATERMQEEKLLIDGQTVKIKPFILPHISNLSVDELKAAGGEEGLRKHQGFYIYRNRRLIIWGTWFRLTRQAELSKLARVRVDIPNSLDHLWSLDIKKSAAHPPEQVRDNLKRFIDKIVGNSKRTYTFRGRKTSDKNVVHTWQRNEHRDGISYSINRDHPLLQTLYNYVTGAEEQTLKLFLETIENTFPADALYADMASDRPQLPPDETHKQSLLDLARLLVEAAKGVSGGKKRLLSNLKTLEPFNMHPEITDEILEELTDAC